MAANARFYAERDPCNRANRASIREAVVQVTRCGSATAGRRTHLIRSTPGFDLVARKHRAEQATRGLAVAVAEAILRVRFQTRRSPGAREKQQ
jgi:hypothetical protein